MRRSRKRTRSITGVYLLGINNLDRLSAFRWMTPREMKEFGIVMDKAPYALLRLILCRGTRWSVFCPNEDPLKDHLFVSLFPVHKKRGCPIINLRPNRERFGNVRIDQVPKEGYVAYHPIFAGGTEWGKEFRSMAEAIGWTSHLLEMATYEP